MGFRIVLYLLALNFCSSLKALPHSEENFSRSPEKCQEDFDYKIYFSDHMRWENGDGLIQNTERSMARALKKKIHSSRNKIQSAIYGVREQSWFFEALEQAGRDLTLEAVIDQKSSEKGDWLPENFTYSDTPKLRHYIADENLMPDINNRSDRAFSSIMHNKFFVFDEESVWLGSTNISSTGIGDEYNANLSLHIDSQSLAKLYSQEFQQMLRGGRFSVRKKNGAPKTLRYCDGSQVDVFFSPQDKPVQNAIVPFLRSAKKEIRVAMFFLTHPAAIQEMIRAKKRGVRVRLIQDALAARHPSSQVKTLRKNGVEVFVESWGGKMHMKAASVDGNKTLLGSMNWTKSGEERNDENTLVIRNANLAREFDLHFEQMWSDLESTASPATADFFAASTSLNFRHWASGQPMDPTPESLQSRNSCHDGIDNDYDGYKDADDFGCQN